MWCPTYPGGAVLLDPLPSGGGGVGRCVWRVSSFRSGKDSGTQDKGVSQSVFPQDGHRITGWVSPLGEGYPATSGNVLIYCVLSPARVSRIFMM